MKPLGTTFTGPLNVVDRDTGELSQVVLEGELAADVEALEDSIEAAQADATQALSDASDAQDAADAAQVDATQALSDASDAQDDIDAHVADAAGAHASTAIAFTPAVGADWSPSPTTVGEALDQIAARLQVLEP
jgi:hypothetical protein